jgi:hypothetical protein
MHMDRDIDRVIAELRSAYPHVTCAQLHVAHPGADDAGLWFFTHPTSRGEVQLESPTGAAPFLVEGTDAPERDMAPTVARAVALVAARLGLVAGTG